VSVPSYVLYGLTAFTLGVSISSMASAMVAKIPFSQASMSVRRVRSFSA
jgi:hypothetical protein